MPAPANPPYHPTPTPTPRPATPGYFSPADYVSLACDELQTAMQEQTCDRTGEEFLAYLVELKETLYKAEE